MEETENRFDVYVGIKFIYTTHAYYFGAKGLDLKIGDKVIVETVHGPELGEVVFKPISIDEYRSTLELRPVLRMATDIDKKMHENNLKDAVFALEICKDEVKKANLDMILISCEYNLDKSKVIFSYVADDRVDFRELLKALASKLHTRIELRQIGSRDKAKLIGGLGMCGLPLCCATYLNEFDGISINRAKNQMLAINIPKLSGQCGKLMCCLKYEDDTYTDLKKDYPEIGMKVFIDKVEYEVTSINVISKTVKIDAEEDVKVLTLEDFKKQTNFRPKSDKVELEEKEEKKEKPEKPKKHFKHNKKTFKDNNEKN